VLDERHRANRDKAWTQPDPPALHLLLRSLDHGNAPQLGKRSHHGLLSAERAIALHFNEDAGWHIHSATVLATPANGSVDCRKSGGREQRASSADRHLHFSGAVTPHALQFDLRPLFEDQPHRLTLIKGEDLAASRFDLTRH